MKRLIKLKHQAVHFWPLMTAARFVHFVLSFLIIQFFFLVIATITQAQTTPEVSLLNQQDWVGACSNESGGSIPEGGHHAGLWDLPRRAGDGCRWGSASLGAPA